MKWMGHVERIGQKRNAYKILDENLKEEDHLKDLDVDGRIILKCMLKSPVGIYFS
jgi:hypothetical protein